MKRMMTWKRRPRFCIKLWLIIWPVSKRKKKKFWKLRVIWIALTLEVSVKDLILEIRINKVTLMVTKDKVRVKEILMEIKDKETHTETKDQDLEIRDKDKEIRDKDMEIRDKEILMETKEAITDSDQNKLLTLIY